MVWFSAAYAALAAQIRETVTYTAGGVHALGFLAYDNAVCTSSSPCPGVLIVQDWDGMNQYEMDRACSVASMGYVAFAADIYGVDMVTSWGSTPTFGNFAAASTMHRRNATLYMGKIMDGLSVLSGYNFVHSSKLAAIGYCFGGTGVINLALTGYGGQYGVPSGLLGVVAYHAGSTGLLQPSGSSHPKLVIHAGWDDQAQGISNSSMTTLEQSMEGKGLNYEVAWYGSNVGHGFTHWGGAAYIPLVDKRSWDATRDFFAELFTSSGATPTARPASAPSSPLVQQMVDYSADGVASQGFLVYNSNQCTAATKCPGVVVIQDWNGMNEYEKDRAHLLANMGYVAFAADIYGKDLVASWGSSPSFTDWSTASTMHRQNASMYMAKIMDGIGQLTQYNMVDSNKIAAIGYCFGGTGVINLALAGHGGTYAVPTGLVGVVAYHAGAIGLIAAESAATRPKLVVHAGRNDPAINSAQMNSLMADLESKDASFQVSWYGSSVGHGFTEWSGRAYNAFSDLHSWQHTTRFLAETFSGSTSGSSKPSSCTAPTATPTATPPATPSATSGSVALSIQFWMLAVLFGVLAFFK